METRRAIPYLMLASLAIHGVTLYGLDDSPPADRKAIPPQEKVFELVPNKPPEPPPLPRHGQVVETPDLPESLRAPENARFLSERNLQVASETIGPMGFRPGRSLPALTSPNRPPRPEPEPAPENKFGEVEARRLYPSFRDLWQVAPDPGGRIDHLEGVVEGEITSLNTQAFRYAAFYNRVKQAVRAYWNPNPALQNSGPPRHNLDSYIRVITDAEGKLVSVEVVHSCGYPQVDQAAVRAIQKATPFYGVPEGILNPERRFDEVWGFHVILD